MSLLTGPVSPRRNPSARAAARWFGPVLLACVAVAFVSGACAWVPGAASGATAPGATAPGATAPGATAPGATTSGAAPSASLNLGGAEQKVLAVLEVIDRTGRAPDGYRGGTQFMNDGREGGEVLPRTDGAGEPITYREWDVNPYTGANRGAERLVTGSDGSAWYTADHYDSFVRIR